MRTLERDKKPLYVCKRIENTNPQQYEAPIMRKLNTVATTSEADIVAFGESYKEYRRAKITYGEKSYYNEGDRAYIFVAPPETHDELCSGCDFEIVSVLDSVSQVEILFKRLQIGKD